MKIEVSPSPATSCPSGAARDSSVRTEVVPTAHSLAPPDRAAVQSLGRVDVEAVPLGMQPVLGHFFHLHGLERSRPDVEQDVRQLHAARCERGQQVAGKVQAGGRRGDGTLLARVHRLVALAVCRAVFAGDVGRERDVSMPLEQRWRRRRRRPVARCASRDRSPRRCAPRLLARHAPPALREASIPA